MRGLRRETGSLDPGDSQPVGMQSPPIGRWAGRLGLVGSALDEMGISLRDILIVLDGEKETDGTLVSMLCARRGLYIDVWKSITFSSMNHTSGSLAESFAALADLSFSTEFETPPVGDQPAAEEPVTGLEGQEAEDAELLASTQLGRAASEREPRWEARFRGAGALLDRLDMQVRSATVIDLDAGVFVNAIVQADDLTPGWNLRSFSFSNRQVAAAAAR
jgi:hypothetical protein